MAKNFTEADLVKMGLMQNQDGSYSKPGKEVVKIAGGHELVINETIIPKEKVNDTPALDFSPKTEWFIKNYNVPSKKNSRRNFVNDAGKQISLPSQNHEDYVKATAMQYAVFGKEFKRAIERHGLSYPLKVEFTFIRSSRRRSDYTNMCQTVEDLMVKNNWIPDDDTDHIIPVFAQARYDKETPGVIIKLILYK